VEVPPDLVKRVPPSWEKVCVCVCVCVCLGKGGAGAEIEGGNAVVVSDGQTAA
jgi:hypothetical protein